MKTILCLIFIFMTLLIAFSGCFTNQSPNIYTSSYANTPPNVEFRAIGEASEAKANKSKSSQNRVYASPNDEFRAMGEEPKSKLTPNQLRYRQQAINRANLTVSISIGMSREQVKNTIGNPDKINNTAITSTTIYEQWIYGEWQSDLYYSDSVFHPEYYLNFENGILVSIQHVNIQ